jgi:hypothetical protein
VPPFPSGHPAITTIWDWLNALNSANFAGHSDWRIPTMAGNSTFPTGEPAELESLLDPTHGVCASMSGNCIDPIFEPESGLEWSASTDPFDLQTAYNFWFFAGGPGSEDKNTGRFVRAVRSVP